MSKTCTATLAHNLNKDDEHGNPETKKHVRMTQIRIRLGVDQIGCKESMPTFVRRLLHHKKAETTEHVHMAWMWATLRIPFCFYGNHGFQCVFPFYLPRKQISKTKQLACDVSDDLGYMFYMHPCKKHAHAFKFCTTVKTHKPAPKLIEQLLCTSAWLTASEFYPPPNKKQQSFHL